MTNSDSHTASFARPIVKFGIGLIALLVLRSILQQLPMLEGITTISSGEGRIPFAIPYSEIAAVIINTLIIIWLLIFGKEIGNVIKTRLRGFEESAKLTNLLMVLIALLIAYGSYSLLGTALVRDRGLYNWIFLIATAIPVVALIYVGYRNIDQITDLFVSRFRKLGNTEVKKCPHCGALLEENARFCKECGNKISIESELETAKTTKCSKCGAVMSIPAKFCPECGSPVVVKPV